MPLIGQNRSGRPWARGQLVVTVALVALGLGACELAGAENGDAAGDDMASLVEACRSARNMVDANIAANITSEGGQDVGLREVAEAAAEEFFRVANQVDDGEFSEWAVRWRFARAEVIQVDELRGFDPDWEEPSPGALQRDLEAAGQIRERCLEQAGVDVQRDPELIAEYNVSQRRLSGS